MDYTRKNWLILADDYVRNISEKEKYLALLKKDKAPPYRIKAVEEEINFLVNFYNQTEKMMEVHEAQRLDLLIQRLMLGTEIKQLIRMLTHLRTLSADPAAFMELISYVNDSAAEVTGDSRLLPPDKKFQKKVDQYYKEVMKTRKDQKQQDAHRETAS